MEPKASPSALCERHFLASQAWIGSKFRDESSAMAAIEALKEWLGGYPNQVADISKIALASAFTAVAAAAHEIAAGFTAVAVDGSTFAPVTTQDECAAAALAALILAESELEIGKASDGGSLLRYARVILARMDATSALRVWGHAQCELIAGALAEALLERKQAEMHYDAARDIGEPLIRNPRLRKQLSSEWIRAVYGDVKEIATQDQFDTLVQNLVRSQYVIAALAAARVAPPDGAANAAQTAAAACVEFGVPRTTSSVDVHAAFDRLPNEARLATLDDLLARLTSDPKGNAIAAALLGLRANTALNIEARRDFQRAGDAAGKAGDGYAWTTLTADTISHDARVAGKSDRGLIDTFLLAYANVEERIRRTPRHLPFRAHFEPALRLVTADALNGFAGDRSLRASAHLSACLEAGRGPAMKFDVRPASESKTLLQQARVVATDWLGRIAHAVKSHPDVLVLIPASLPLGTALICIADNAAGGIETHVAGNDFAVAAGALADAMRQQFETGRSRADLTAPGRAAFDALPGRVRDLLRQKRTVLLVPDFAAEQSAIPYELFHGPADFLGITHVVARFMTLRAAAFALEPELLPAASAARALCVAAPDTVPNEPLRFADQEIGRVRDYLAKANWSVPAIEASQVSPSLLLNGLERGTLVHIAAHGETFEGSHAILLPGGERLVANAVASRQGELSAAVYLSACSIGASEYLGGGVSRGFAAALAAKGAPVVVASQWPLQDAAAERFAPAFYESALTTGVGEAIRTARESLARTVAPALWGSLILIGNPWHRLGAAEASRTDAAVELLRVASDPSADESARNASLSAAAKALRAEPNNRRLVAAMTWAMEARIVFGQRSEAPSVAWAEQMADLARDLGTPAGEVISRTTAADLLRAEGRSGPARAALDRAIDVCGGIVRRNDHWDGALRNLLAERQRMDLDFEVPEIKTAFGTTVNDRSDPAIRAFFEIQDSIDRQDIRRDGAMRPRLPDTSLQDLCWNAVVLGQRNRFPDEFACAGFARQLAARSTAARWIPPAMEADARRVAAGLLRFLWSTQRMTNLPRETAIGQTGTLCVALGALERDRAIAGSEGAQQRACLESLAEQVVAAADALPGDRFARIRDRLQNRAQAANATGLGPNTTGLGKAATEYIAQARPGSSSRAHRAAWVLGWLLELAYEVRLNKRTELADRILTECRDLERAIEGHIMAYLTEGFEVLSNMRMDPLIKWR